MSLAKDILRELYYLNGVVALRPQHHRRSAVQHAYIGAGLLMLCGSVSSRVPTLGIPSANHGQSALGVLCAQTV